MVVPNGIGDADQVLLTFRKRGTNLAIATAFLVLPVLVGVSVAIGGAGQHDPGQRDFGMTLAAVFGVFAAVFLAWQFRPGRLTASELELPVGLFGHAWVPLSEIDDVGMVYTAPAGWLQYVWRTDGRAMRLPLLKLDHYVPDRNTHVQDWRLLADTQQGRVCLAIDRAVRGTDSPRAGVTPTGRRAGQRRETSFWSADPAVGVISLVGEPARAAYPVPVPPDHPASVRRPGRPTTRPALVILGASSLVLPVLIGVVVASWGGHGGLQPAPFFGGLAVGLAALVALPTMGYRLTPLDAGYAGAAAALASRQQYMSHMNLRMVIVAVPALVAGFLTIGLSPSPTLINYLPGGVLTLLLAIWHVVPNRWNVARSKKSLERNGGHADFSQVER